MQHRPGIGNGNLDDRLVGLDLDHVLVCDHFVAHGDQPGDDLRLGEPLADVGKSELTCHGVPLPSLDSRPQYPIDGGPDAVDPGQVQMLSPFQREHCIPAGHPFDGGLERVERPF